MSPNGPCVPAQGLAGAGTFPGLVIIISFLPRNAAPGHRLDATLSLADMAELLAPWCQVTETQVSLEREPPTFNASQASPFAAGTHSWSHQLAQGSTALSGAEQGTQCPRGRQQDYLQHQNKGWNAERHREVQSCPYGSAPRGCFVQFISWCELRAGERHDSFRVISRRELPL